MQSSRCVRQILCGAVVLAILASPTFAGELRSRQAVANRDSGTVTLIDSDDEAVIHIELGENAEPMYVWSPIGTHELWIGDRTNDRVLVFSTARWRQAGEVATSSGVFHMWGNRQLGQLWIVCETDKVLTVVDLEEHAGLATVPIPSDLEADFKPHDVTATADRAIVTLVGTSDPSVGYLVAFDGATFAEVGRLEVGGDPHVFHWGFGDPYVYVATQSDGKILRVDPLTLTVTGELDFPGAHGVTANPGESLLYVTNIESDDSTSALASIDLASFTIVAITDSAAPFPHNVAVAPDGSRLFVTHSNSGSLLTSVYDVDESGVPGSGRALETGEIPFGIGLVLDPQRP